MNLDQDYKKPTGMNTLITIFYLVIFVTMNEALLNRTTEGALFSDEVFFWVCNGLLLAVVLYAYIKVNFFNNYNE